MESKPHSTFNMANSRIDAANNSAFAESNSQVYYPWDHYFNMATNFSFYEYCGAQQYESNFATFEYFLKNNRHVDNATIDGPYGPLILANYDFSESALVCNYTQTMLLCPSNKVT